MRQWRGLAALGLLAQVAAAPVVTTPAPGPVRVIGSGLGCIAGAVRLPDAAPGLQTVRLGKSTFWGHPEVLANILLLGQRAKAAGLPDLYMGDLSGPRGGPIPGGHASHQRGLDADVYLDVVAPHPVLPLAQREGIEPPSLVRPDGRGIEPARWRPEHVALLKLATQLPLVDRVLVNAAIKKQLCETVTGDRSWLHLVRPWYGHASHMHISFRCPAGQAECKNLPPPPADEDCGANLQWWFTRLDAKPGPVKPESKPPPPPKPPAACAAIMAAP